MPASSTHIQQARHNQALAHRLAAANPIEFKDWAMIVAFYAAVHFVEACRDSVEYSHSSDHGDRLQAADRLLSTQARKAYRHLYYLSLALRYLEARGRCCPAAGAWITDQDVLRAVNEKLHAVEQESTLKIRPVVEP